MLRVLPGFVALMLTSAVAAAAEAPEYSPLPPPGPPPAELAPKPAPRPAPVTAPHTTSTASTTTTTSAALPESGAPRAAAEAPASPSSPTSALEDDRLSIAPLMGFGTDNLDLGVGIRAGKLALAEHVWLGGSAVYHLGHGNSGAVNGVRYESSSSALFLGPEVGYDVELGPVVLRPYGGVGLGAFTASASAGAVRASDTQTKLVIWPGVTVLYGLVGSRFFVGGDARLVTVPGGPALGLFALGGLTL
jgi:hypothetical protein